MSTFQVTACPHPLRADRLQFDMSAGATIEDAIVEAAERAGVGLRGMANAVAVIGDCIVPKDQWKHVRPKAGALVAIKAQPADPISLSIAASVATWAASAAIPTAFALAYPIATSLIVAGTDWTAPLHSSVTP